MHRILVFGDSISAGRGIEKNLSWPSRLADFFDSEDKVNNLFYNLGVAGESTKELLGRLESECSVRTRKYSPSDINTIIFAIGINDSKGLGSQENFNTSKEHFVSNLDKIIKIARNNADRIIVVGLSPVVDSLSCPINNLYFCNQSIYEYNEILSSYCRDHGIHYVDIFLQWTKEGYDHLITQDGVHPNEAGHERIYEAIRSVFSGEAV